LSVDQKNLNISLIGHTGGKVGNYHHLSNLTDRNERQNVLGVGWGRSRKGWEGYILESWKFIFCQVSILKIDNYFWKNF